MPVEMIIILGIVVMFVVVILLLPMLRPLTEQIGKKDQVYVRRINGPYDSDVNQLLHVYQRTMSNEPHSPPSDIKRWLGEYNAIRHDPNRKLDEYWLITKYNGRIINFLYFQYYLQNRFMFISYYGVDNVEAPLARDATLAMVAEVKNLLQHDLGYCKGILYETSHLDRWDTSATRSEKHARNRLFAQYAQALGYAAYELDIEYKTPQVFTQSLSSDDESLALSYIPLRYMAPEETLSKNEVLEILNFVYLQVYADSYNDNPAKMHQYRAYLQRLFLEYQEQLPERIELIQHEVSQFRL